MAKEKMICPFSKGLCMECPQYRGRHYYLCFCTKYRGYLGGTRDGKTRGPKVGREGSPVEVAKAILASPTCLVLNDFAERRNE
ncbi:MAG: hypothetical protein ACUVXD_12500 [Thermodesulfobacteriota bacterium]